jgi:hypothetical protein
MSDEVSQTELLESHSRSIQADLRVSLPARIIKYNGDGTAQVEVLINQVNQNNEAVSIPVLSDVPVQMWSYGIFSITAEPQKGDEGLVHFADRCIDGWWHSGEKSVPLDDRMHDLSDAFFSLGYRSQPKALKITTGAMNIGSESAYVRIKDDGTIEIKGATTFLNEVTAPNFTTTSGIKLDGHKHGGVQNGNGDTGASKP